MAAKRRSKRSDAQENRKKLLRATREALAERGFETEIGDILSRAKVGSGTVYRNFGSKETLILEVCRELINEVAAEIVSAQASAEDAREALRRTLEISFKQIEAYEKVVGDLFAGTAPAPYSEVLNLEAHANFFKLLLRRGMDQGHFRSDLDVDFVSALGWVLVSPTPYRVMRERPPPEVTALVIDFFLAAICATAPERDRDQP